MNLLRRSLKKLYFKDFLIIISNLFFCGLYFVLSINNRISHDDFYSIYIVEKFGVIEGVKLLYNQWCTRYVSLLISFFITSLLRFKITLIIYQLFLFTVSSISTFLLLEKLKKYISDSLSKVQLINYSIFINSAIFYCSFDIGQTWFWLSSNCTYLLSCVILIFSISTIISDNKSYLSFISIVLSGIIIGGSNGTLSFILLLLLTCIFTNEIFKKNKIFGIQLKSIRLKKWITLYISIHLSFVILYLGNGNEIRASFFQEINVFKALIDNFKYSGIILVKKIPSIIPYCLLFSLGFNTIFKSSKKRISSRSFFKKLIFSMVIFLTTIYLFQLPISYKTQDIGADRTIYPIAIITFILFIYIFYQLDKTIVRNKKGFNKLKITSLLIVIFLNIFQLYTQKQISESYSKSFDKRMSQIRKQLDNNQIVLEPLADPGFLHSAEISEKSSHFTQKQLKLGLKIKGKIKLNISE